MKIIEHRYGTDENGLYYFDNFRLGKELTNVFKRNVSSNRLEYELQAFRKSAHRIIKEVKRRADSCNCSVEYLLKGYCDGYICRNID